MFLCVLYKSTILAPENERAREIGREEGKKKKEHGKQTRKGRKKETKFSKKQK